MTGIPIPIVCLSCGQRGAVNKVTAGLRCRCGSTELDVDDFEATAAQHVAYPKGPYEGWDKPMPSKTKGWSDYEGPPPGANPVGQPPVNDNMICPACHGAGYDISDKTRCRMCNGYGTVKPTTGRPDVESYDATTSGPPVGGARWQGRTSSTTSQGSSLTAAVVVGPVQISGGGGAGVTVVAGRPSKADPYGTADYQNQHGAPGYLSPGPSGEFKPGDLSTYHPKADTIAPAVHHREQRDYSAPTAHPYQMNEASCPNCGHAPTELRKDRNEDAWWHCPNCGPLANIDKRPDVNPYHPPEGFEPDRSMKTSHLRRNQKTGKLLAIVATVQQANSGIELAQAITLARKTLAYHPEG